MPISIAMPTVMPTRWPTLIRARDREMEIIVPVEPILKAVPTKLLRIEARNAEVPIEKKPHWIKTKAVVGPEYNEMKELARGQGLHTVCEEAGCPLARYLH